MTIARYAFLPWLRRGVANQIQTPAVTTSRARLQVALTVGDGTETRVVDKDIQLVGPGDMLGINPQEIIRTEPRGWVTDFEPNSSPSPSSTTRIFPGATRPTASTWRAIA